MSNNKKKVNLDDLPTVDDRKLAKRLEALEDDIQRGSITISQWMAAKGIEGGVSLDTQFDTTAASLLESGSSCKYKIDEIMAKGGMGMILNAKDLNCRRKVAMKILNDDQNISPDQILRFIVEAQICAQLEHPGIVPVYELSVDASGDVFYTMKLVNGETLVDIIIEIKSGNAEYISKYPLIRLLNIYLRICDAVAFAHSKNVIHRDLKPENIMIGDFGEVLVMDWGLAKILENKKSDVDHAPAVKNQYDAVSTNFDNVDSILMEGELGESIKTMYGQIMGTPGFMPPEQALGKVEDIDTRSDVYALGGILFNILALQPPITGMSIKDIVRRIIKGDIRPPMAFNSDSEFAHCPGNKIPETLSKISMKGLSSHPADRYSSVKELQDDIEKYLGGFATSVEEAGLVKLLILMVKRNRTAVLSFSIAFLILIGVISGFMIKVVEAKNEAEQNLNKFLSEHDARNEISRKLLQTAIQALRQHNPDQEILKYQYSFIDNDFTLHLEDNESLNDIEPLEELPLNRLNLSHTNVSNIKALRNMPLKWLNLSNTDVANIRNLALLPLGVLNLSHTRVNDLSPLVNLTLRELSIEGTTLKSFQFVYDLPLESLSIDGHQLSRMDIENFKAMKLKHLTVKQATNENLGIVRELGLASLELHGRYLTNLFPIRNTGLKTLSLIGTRVRDLTSIKYLDLESLRLSGSLVDDISAIENMPLKELYLEKCYYIKDLTVISTCYSLEKLLIPSHISNIDFLRALPNLKILANNKTDYDSEQDVVYFWETIGSNEQ